MDYILKYSVNIIQFVEMLAALIGLIYYKKYKETITKYFIWYLIYIVVLESVGKYALYVRNGGFFSFLKGTLIESNHWWYTIFWQIGAILFFSFYFRKVLENVFNIAFLRILTLLFVSSSLVSILLDLKLFFKGWIPLIRISGAVVIFSCVILYFLELLRSDKILHFHKSLSFYISITILVFWLITTPLIFYAKYYTVSDWSFIYLKHKIYVYVNVFMYLMFSVGLIVSKPEKESK